MWKLSKATFSPIDFDYALWTEAGSLAPGTGLQRRNRFGWSGNLPYYITSDILLRLFEYHDNISTLIVIMVQKEVADRLAAHRGTRDYGLLSATAQLYSKVEKLFTLPPGAFCAAAESAFLAWFG